jgi:hypothetical protein
MRDPKTCQVLRFAPDDARLIHRLRQELPDVFGLPITGIGQFRVWASPITRVMLLPRGVIYGLSVADKI